MSSLVIRTVGICFLVSSLLVLAQVLFKDQVVLSASQLEPDTVPFTKLVGDGLTDNTQQLQALADAGGSIRLPKGTFLVTKPIEIHLNDVGYTSIHGDGVAQIVMAGAGPAFRFIGTHFRSADPAGFDKQVWQRQRMPLVDGIGIQGAHQQACGVEAVGTMQMTISRCHMRGLLHGIHLVKNNRNVIISECHIYENKGVGIFYDDVNLHQSNVTNCHVSYNEQGRLVSRKGNVRNIHIAGCDFESNMAPETPPAANILIDCTGSSAGTGEVAVTGCTIQHNHNSPESANIRIIGNSSAQNYEGHVTIAGNVISDVMTNIHLKQCRGVVVTGNTIWKGFTHNLLVEDCNNIIVGPNNFDRNPRYNSGAGKNSRNSVLFRGCEDCTLTALHVSHIHNEPAGMILENCKRMNVTNCTILDCDNAGLLLKNVTQSQVGNCLIRDDRENTKSVSIKIMGGSDNQIQDH